MKSFAQSILHYFRSFLLWIGVVATAIILCLTSADVLLRYLFNSPITGAFEITEVLMALIGFLPLAYIQYKGAHIEVELLTSKVESATALTIIDVLRFSISAVFCLFIGIYSIEHVVEAIKTHETVSGSAIEIPLAPGRTALTIGLLTLGLQYVIDAFSKILTLMGRRA